MPGKTQGDRILKIEENVSTLLERVDNLRMQIGGVEKAEARTRLSVLDEKVKSLEKRLDHVLALRSEWLKLFAAAFLGGVVTIAAGFVSQYAQRMIDSNWTQSTPIDDPTRDR